MGSRSRRAPEWVLRLVLGAALLATGTAEGTDSPKNRSDYWRANFDELTPGVDPRAAKAHEIFDRLLRVAGRRPGVTPRLFIASSGAPYVSLAFAIPDGGVIISRELLDICYAVPALGEDRLAFVLAHEIAHQLKDDFWHFRFFEALVVSQGEDEAEDELLAEVRAIAAQTDDVLAKELQADEQGIVYASMAGFDTAAILGVEGQEDFFEHFYRAMDPSSLDGIDRDPSHPSPRQRAETVRVRLRQVLEQVDLFRVGLMFYQAGDYEAASTFFESFATFFPSREVYHDLATSYHQAAITYYQEWKAVEEGSGAPPIPFKLSISVDPETRATAIDLRSRGRSKEEELFDQAIRKAVEHYETAISLDPAYAPSKNNLACALILLGEPYAAVGVLRRVLEDAPERTDTLNNLGVAYFYTDDPGKARETLEKTAGIDPSYDAPVYNLARLAEKEGDAARATTLWNSYLELDPVGPWADGVRQALGLEVEAAGSERPDLGPEDILGIKAEDWADAMPEEWGEPIERRELPLQERPFLLETYANGATVVSQDAEIRVLATPAGYDGESAGGVRPGSTEQKLLSRYGAPSRILDLSQWESWVYEEQGIAFQVRDGTVLSWLLFG